MAISEANYTNVFNYLNDRCSKIPRLNKIIIYEVMVDCMLGQFEFDTRLRLVVCDDMLLPVTMF